MVASRGKSGSGAASTQASRVLTVPTYQYACSSCDHQFEAVQSFSDDPLTECPACPDGRVRKRYGSVGVVFKGSGFYRTDSRKEGGAKKSASSGAKSGEKSASKDTPSGAKGNASSNGSASSGTSPSSTTAKSSTGS